MPKFWDCASFIGNIVLFDGLQHPVVQSVLQSVVSQEERLLFQFALKARVIMASLTNVALAYKGHGDVDFAQAQFHRANDFLAAFNNVSLWD